MKNVKRISFLIVIGGLLIGCKPGPVHLGSTTPPMAVTDSQGHTNYVQYNFAKKRTVYVPKSAKGSDLITSKILAAYAQDPVLSQYNIGVLTNRNEVTLMGKVPDKNVRNYAIKVARYTKGVLMVHDRLIITGQ